MRFLGKLLHSMLDWNVRTYRGDETVVSLVDAAILRFCEEGVEVARLCHEDTGVTPTLESVSDFCAICDSSFQNAAIELHMLRAGQIPQSFRISKRLIWLDDSLVFIAPFKWWHLKKWSSDNYTDYWQHHLIMRLGRSGNTRLRFFDFFTIGFSGGRFTAHTQVGIVPTGMWLRNKKEPAWYKPWFNFEK